MSVSAYLTELKKKHEILGLEVEEAQRSRGIDDLHIRVVRMNGTVRYHKDCFSLRHRLLVAGTQPVSASLDT